VNFSNKHWDFIDHKAPVEFLEGTTASGKTVAGLHKFILECAESHKRLHVLAAKTTGVAEKNLLNSDAGLVYQFGSLIDYQGNGSAQNKLPHIILHAPGGDKIIYVLGYDNRDKWLHVLGSQFGAVMIDEINTAHPDFVREISMRCDYLLGTLNPDDPYLPIYEEYINHARPLPKYVGDAPAELGAMLNAPPKPGWVHWFFSFDHNVGMTPEKRAKICENVPPGTKLYKNKILGLRGKATGLVFPNFDRQRHTMTAAKAKEEIPFVYFVAGVDTAYSSQSEDTIAMLFCGVSKDRRFFVLDERVYNNRDLQTPIAPSDTAKNLVDFLRRNQEQWGFGRTAFVDSADSATLTELAKYKRNNPCLYSFAGADKQETIINRIELQLGWLHTGHYVVLDNCTHHIRELESYAWKEDKDSQPEDRNDHTINAAQYAFLPYKTKIGGAAHENHREGEGSGA
jgi:PBSX family phage terminase large subunit